MRLTGFPIPPTSNKLYASYRGRFIKTADARRFDASIEAFRILRHKHLEELKHELAKDAHIRVDDAHIKVDTVFVFHKPRIVSKINTLK